MQALHTVAAMLPQLRAFLVVSEEGSINRAAERLRLSQSALSRQMQALEHEMGGPLLERNSSGIKLTPGGLALQAKLGAVLAGYDRAVLEVRQIVRGEQTIIRIGYIASAAKEYLDAALKHVRAEHPGLVLKLLDLSPGEQIAALRAGEIDVGLTDESAEVLARECYTRVIGSVPSVVALPEQHRFRHLKSIRLAQLKNEVFVKSDEGVVPGLTRRTTAFCWKYGKFRPRYVGPTKNLAETFEMVANENAVVVAPSFVRHNVVTGVIMIPLADEGVTWKLLVVWQRGKPSKPLRTLLDALFQRPSP
jgi:DNA-binding transcriptional LysR family regulator